MAFYDVSMDRQREITARQRALENQIASSFVEGVDEAQRNKRAAALRAAEIAREDQLRGEERAARKEEQDYNRRFKMAELGIEPDMPKLEDSMGQELAGPVQEPAYMSPFQKLAKERQGERATKREQEEIDKKLKAAQYREQFGDFKGSRKEQEMMAQAEIDRAKALATLKNPEIKQNQDVAAGFSRRARLATQELASLPRDYGTGGISATIQGSSLMPEAAKTEERKLFEQSANNFISAVLRKESGAAISPQEYANEFKKYFPMPGDTEKVIAQKERAREQAMLNLEAEAGMALAKGQTVIAPLSQGAGAMDAMANDNPFMSVDEGSLLRRREELLRKAK